MKGNARAPGDEGPSTIYEVPETLQRDWVRQLQKFYELYNHNYAGKKLRRPLFRIGFGSERLGQWDRSVRTLTISAKHILEHPWESVLDTLRHEMAHQYVNEVMGLTGAPPHGETFAKACQVLRVDPARTRSAAGLGRIESSAVERDRILSRVKLLLALAKSPNEHEAANAMRMANKYLLKYNLDLAQAEGPLEYETRHLGRCSARIQECEYVLAQILQEHFFVQVIWTFSYDAVADRKGRILQISGTPENLEMAEYVYHYVMNLTERLWESHRKGEEARGGTRLQYLAGLLRGLQEKLDSQRLELKEQFGLIWLGDLQLKKYYRYINPYVRTTGTSGVSRGERFRAGLRDGRKITIHKGVGGETARANLMLPGRPIHPSFNPT